MSSGEATSGEDIFSSKERSDSILKFQSQISGPNTSPALKKGTASIQNFMFLVENGDIPKPEENVLNEPLVKSSPRPRSQIQQQTVDNDPVSSAPSENTGDSIGNKGDPLISMA